MSERYIASVDQGTASSRCLVFDRRARVVSVSQVEHEHIFPRPGLVEHDPEEIWRNVQHVVADALAKAQLSVVRHRRARHHQPARDDRALGRARPASPCTTRSTGRTRAPTTSCASSAATTAPTASATAAACRSRPTSPARRSAGCSTTSTACAERAEAGEVLFGTMDSWLIWKLCGRHITDVTNAGRTMLMNLETLDWDDVLLDAIGVPRAMLPEIRPSMEVYGEAGGALAGLPVAAALGDQHAALFGQTCFEPGDAKCTYGTGSFLLMNTGDEPVRSGNGLLTTVGYKIGDEPRDLRARGLDRGHRRARAVVPRQDRADRQRVRDRDARAHRRRQRRLLLRAGVLRAVRAALAQRRARRDRRADRLHHQGPPRPRRAGGDRLADARGRRGDERGRRRRAVVAQGRRRHDGQQPADAVARRRARRAGRAPDRGRDAVARRGLRGRAGGRLLVRRRRAARAAGTRRPSGCPRWSRRCARRATASGARPWRAPSTGSTRTTTDARASGGRRSRGGRAGAACDEVAPGSWWPTLRGPR